MPRPDIDMSLGGYVTYSSQSGVGTPAHKAGCVRTFEHVVGVRRRKPKGWLPPTDYYLEREEYSRALGTAKVSISKNNWNQYSGYVGASGRFNSDNHFNDTMSETTADTPLSSSAALVAARNKLKGQAINLGVAFAERKKTAQMLGDNLFSIGRSIIKMRRGDVRGALREIGVLNRHQSPRGSQVTNRWLELQYGIKPLLADVYGACAALSKRDREDWRVTVKASRRDKLYASRKTTPSGSAYPTGNYDAYGCTAVRNRGVFVRIDALPQNDLHMSLSSLGVTNPLLIGWELVPLSFVVDWALPVGDWLGSLDALLGYGPAYTSITYYNETLWHEVGVSRYNYSNANAYVSNSWNGYKRRLVIDRNASYGVPLPAFPSLKDPGSLGHMANGLALVCSLFGRQPILNFR